MEELLTGMVNKRIDVTCSSNATVRGDVVEVKDGVLYLKDDEDKLAFVAVDKIAVVYECNPQQTRPGFVA